MENDLYKKAKERVKEVRGFYFNLISYVIINTIFYLFIGRAWLWVIAFWGLGLIFHFLNTFILSKEWEEKKIKEYVEKEKKLSEKKEEEEKEE